MDRLDDQRLTGKALMALEEVAACCHLCPVRRTHALALVLAYLASRSNDPASLEAFTHFWRAMATALSNARWGNVNAALNGIYLAVGEKRDLAVTSAFERRAREGHSPWIGPPAIS